MFRLLFMCVCACFFLMYPANGCMCTCEYGCCLVYLCISVIYRWGSAMAGTKSRSGCWIVLYEEGISCSRVRHFSKQYKYTQAWISSHPWCPWTSEHTASSAQVKSTEIVNSSQHLHWWPWPRCKRVHERTSCPNQPSDKNFCNSDYNTHTHTHKALFGLWI